MFRAIRAASSAARRADALVEIGKRIAALDAFACSGASTARVGIGPLLVVTADG
jgi:hypothetical protein